ncbi:thioredoxin family protein [Agriterribacter sp.]|uniref:thioredoxin family protein n=1 Tax=Agriterribacter sp. TaxID=2821509 RepID=UPI002C3FC4C2|nr:thioredoxin family protein [Agriterribacter sp.]HRP56529.1 thioredoxin family protein [Agriterribacter sp.]
MKRPTPLMVFILLFLSSAFAQPPSATEVLNEASAQAAKENKNVFVIFHASWCGWCHKMDSSMSDPACKAFFDASYIITHLVVKELKGKEQLENPGALALMKKYKGDQSGIPFWLVFNSKGILLADSKMRPEGAGTDATGNNSGCPATEKEVAYFIEVLKKTSSLNPGQLSIIQKRFRQNEPG